MRSRRGRNALVFLACLCASSILWCVLSLNEEDQADVRIPVRLVNVPDSVTMVSLPPATLAASVRTHGSQLLRLNWGFVPAVDIDFRIYRSGDYLRLSDTDLKALIRSRIEGSTVLVVTPDSLSLGFTTSPGVSLPVIADYAITAGPKASIVSAPHLSVDSVRVFSLEPLPKNVLSVATEPIRIQGLNESVVRRVRLVAPHNARVIPDSVDVAFDVEPLIFKTRRVSVEAINVPAGHKLITFPAQVDVMFMVPLSIYKNADPHIRVVADYKSIDRNNPTRNIRIRVTDVSAGLQNVHLAADSAEYIIEEL